jgi:hypothetical protein
VEAGAVEPDLGVFEGVYDGGPGELLVVGCVAVGFETGLDEGAFVCGEPADGRGVVGDEEVCDGSDDDGKYAFLENRQSCMI